MRRNRLLLPWGLLAGLLIGIAVVQGLNIKAPSLTKKVRNYTTTTSWASTTTTTTTTTETPETTPEEEEHEDEANSTTKSPLSGNPQIDYVFDPNLPRELPRGYNLSEYPFFARVPNDIDFECEGLLDGFYASITYKCQVYHHCISGIRYDFLCANYTAFDQRTFICQFVSEVDCIGSPKYYFRNEPLYKGRITTTTTTTTVAPPPTVATRRPAAGGAGRRRRPFRRRRPQYDYYYDDDYEDDEYDDDLAAQSPAGGGRSQRKRQRRPGAADTAAEAEEKPARGGGGGGGGGGSVYDRPRVLPKIRRPVPLNERDKYDYTPKGGSTDNGGSEKRAQEEPDRATDKESDRPKRPVEAPPTPTVEKAREPEVLPRPRPAKKRPAQAQDDDEYYDDEDYDQPIRTPARKNNQDYYAPSAADRDFARRPAMSGDGRPLRRNRPGRRKPAPVEYDDDYDDRRPLRSSTPADDNRRRPSEDRRRPDDDRRRPDDDRRRPDDDRRRPAQTPRKRGSQQRDEYDRDAAYDRPRENKRPRDSYDRPASSSRDTAYERTPASSVDTSYSRPLVKERPATSSRDTPYERAPTGSADTTYERPAAKERPVAPSRGSTYERTPASSVDASYDKTTSKDTSYERLSGSKKRPQSTRETTFERPRQERPSSRPSTDYDRPVAPITGSGYTTARPLASRGRFGDDADDLEDPIPASKPAYISTTGRSSYRKRGPEEPSSTSAYRVAPPTTSRITEAPPLAEDEEYYDDEEEELEVELPKRPTGSGRTGTGTYRAPPAELPVVKTSRKPSTNRGDDLEEEVFEEPRVGQSTELRGRIGQNVKEERVGSGGKLSEDKGRVEQVPEEKVKVPPTGRERVVPPTGEDGRGRTKPGFEEDGVADERERERDVDERGRVPPPFPRDHPRQNQNYRDTEDIIEQPPPLRATQTNYRTKDEVVDEGPAARQAFKPKVSAEATTEASQRYSNFRRKSNHASNIDTSKVLPSREDRIVEIAEDVHIAPSAQGRTKPTGVGMEEVEGQTDIELESESSRNGERHDSTIQLDTSKFLSSAESESELKKPIFPTGPSGGGYTDKRYSQNVTKFFNKRLPEEVPYKIELPDINDPEYDVTLNEALHPTRPILISTEGSRGKLSKFASYQYRDVSLAPDLLGTGREKVTQTLLTAASQTHVSKAPYPAYGKDNFRHRLPGTLERTHTNAVTSPAQSVTSRPSPQYDDHTVYQGEEYDDPPIPTGRGGSTRYPTTESTFRGSQQPSPIVVSSSRGTSAQQFPGAKVNNQYSPLPTTPATGSLRHLEHELSKTVPRGRLPQQPFRSPSQGTIREADFFRGVANPLTLTLGYEVDYDQVGKYRPRRKYIWRDRSRDYYNVY